MHPLHFLVLFSPFQSFFSPAYLYTNRRMPALISLMSQVPNGKIETAVETVQPVRTTTDPPPSSSVESTRLSSDVSRERIAQLSASLRTRLTYAFVKIQNGWTSRSLDQLEKLTYNASEVKKPEKSVLVASTLSHNNRIQKSRMHRRFNSDLSMINTSEPRASPKKGKHRRPSSISLPTVSIEIPESRETNEADAVESLMFLSSPHSAHAARFS